MTTRPISEQELAAFDREQQAFRDQDARAGYLTVKEAARILGLTAQAISYAIRAGRLPAIKDHGLRGSYWIAPGDLRALYPDQRRRTSGRPRKLTAMTQEEATELLGLTR